MKVSQQYFQPAHSIQALIFNHLWNMKTKTEETEEEDINIYFKQTKDESIRHDMAMQCHQRIDAEKHSTVLI